MLFVFRFEIKKNVFQKISFIFQIWLLNWKSRNEKKIFLNLFWFKTSFKKQKSEFSNSFFDWKSKNEFQKIISFSNVCFEIENWKIKIFKIRFVFKSKKNYTFGTPIIQALKVPFNFDFKIGMGKEIFRYFNFDSKLKIEKR